MINQLSTSYQPIGKVKYNNFAPILIEIWLNVRYLCFAETFKPKAFYTKAQLKLQKLLLDALLSPLLLLFIESTNV